MGKRDKDHQHNTNGRTTTEERTVSRHVVEKTEVTRCTCGEEVGRKSWDVWRD